MWTTAPKISLDQSKNEWKELSFSHCSRYSSKFNLFSLIGRMTTQFSKQQHLSIVFSSSSIGVSFFSHVPRPNSHPSWHFWRLQVHLPPFFSADCAKFFFPSFFPICESISVTNVVNSVVFLLHCRRERKEKSSIYQNCRREVGQDQLARHQWKIWKIADVFLFFFLSQAHLSAKKKEIEVNMLT